MTIFDFVAPIFERHRALPAGTADAVRSTILKSIGHLPRPRFLDVGAGTGRFGRSFVLADDDYVGVDVSIGMLCKFIEHTSCEGRRPRVVQSDGQLLPFRDNSFDAVLLIQVFGGVRQWLRLVGEVRRVLGAAGTVFVGRTMAPDQGIDAQMKQRAASILSEMGIKIDRVNAREDVEQWLESASATSTRMIVTSWSTVRTPRRFLDRHRTGARISSLAEPVKTEVMRRLEAWAVATFGSLDAVAEERDEFALQAFNFQENASART